MSLSPIRPLLARRRRSSSNAETSYLWPSDDSISEGVGEGSGLDGGDLSCICGGAVRARAAPARVVTIVSPSDSLDSASADMEMVQWLTQAMATVQRKNIYHKGFHAARPGEPWQEKLIRRFKEEPLVPIGAFLSNKYIQSIHFTLCQVVSLRFSPWSWHRPKSANKASPSR